MIKFAGNTNYTKTMEILGSGRCGRKNISSEMHYRPCDLLN